MVRVLSVLVVLLVGLQAAETLLPGTARAAEPAASNVVRKKLPETPTAAPAVEQARTPDGTPVAPSVPAAAAPNVVLKKVPEAAAVTASEPAVSKPAEVVAATPVPAAPAPVAPEPPPAVSAAPPPPVPVAVTPAPKPAVKTAAVPGRSPFSILLASCQDRRNAEAALASYRRLGLSPYIVQTDLGPMGTWWRTLAGAYPSYDEAMAAKQGPALAQAVVVKTPYAVLVGEYGSEAEAATAAASLTHKGLFPYLLKGPTAVQVLAGAFPAKSAAESFQRELESLGVTARTIQR